PLQSATEDPEQVQTENHESNNATQTVKESQNTAEQKPFDTKMQEAKEIFYDYHNNTDNFQKSIDILNSIISEHPNDPEAYIFLSRVWLTYGHLIRESGTPEKWERFKKGSEIAQKAIKLDPSDPNAYFNYVANEASLAKSKGVFGSVFLVKRLKKGINKVLELDPEHVEGIALKGAILNSIPGLLGGDVKEAESLLRKALALDPHLTSTKIFLAKNLYKQEQYNDAKTLFNEVLQEENPTIRCDWHLNRRTAIKWLRIIDNEH
ncbi:MAG: tetratricopeptide repeat protein, partial [Candidatus Dadabacteria bacterium]|nr:tetratricopeptide repeat protein [Candidatus Dadabacteria bacterium]